eukprot:scaffold12961_cov56-Cyclotella_meneghiniana.AAC.5
MAAARRCSHRGSWKVDFPASGVGWSAGCGQRCGVPWLFWQQLFLEGVVAAAVGKIPSQIPQENLLIFYSESKRFCSRYFLLTCHDVKTKYRAKYRGKYRIPRKKLLTERAFIE